MIMLDRTPAATAASSLTWSGAPGLALPGTTDCESYIGNTTGTVGAHSGGLPANRPCLQTAFGAPKSLAPVRARPDRGHDKFRLATRPSARTPSHLVLFFFF